MFAGRQPRFAAAAGGKPPSPTDAAAGAGAQQPRVKPMFDLVADDKKGGKAAGKGKPQFNLPYLAMIPRTDVVLEDPTLAPGPPPKRPYPVLDPKTPLGQPAQFHTIPVYVRSDFKTGAGRRARHRLGLIPVSLLGDVPGRPGHNPLQFLMDKRDLDRELKAPGTLELFETVLIEQVGLILIRPLSLVNPRSVRAYVQI